MYRVIETNRAKHQMIVLRDYVVEHYSDKRLDRLEREFAAFHGKQNYVEYL